MICQTADLLQTPYKMLFQHWLTSLAFWVQTVKARFQAPWEFLPPSEAYLPVATPSKAQGHRPILDFRKRRE